MLKSIEVPLEGEFYVKNGKLYRIEESTIIDFEDGFIGYEIWVPCTEDGDPQDYVASDSDR